MQPKKKAAALLLAFVCFLGACTPQPRQEIPVKSGMTFAFDTVIEQTWYGEAGTTAYLDIAKKLGAMESKLSLYRQGSEIDRLNQAAGKEYVPLSEDTFQILKQAKEWSIASGGVFDVTIAPVTTLWGITGEDPKVPGEEELQSALSLVGAEGILLDEATHSAMLAREGMAVDLGGVAKGMLLDQIRGIAQEDGVDSGFVSLGGNILAIGQKPDGKEFVFGLRDPRGDGGEYLGTLSIPGLTMATTGDYERFFEQDGVRYHHVIDPRTGYPAKTDLISLTVISADGGLADYLSTTFFIYGKEVALQYLDEEEFSLIAVDEEKNVYLSPALVPKFTPNEQKTEYTFHLEG